MPASHSHAYKRFPSPPMFDCCICFNMLYHIEFMQVQFLLLASFEALKLIYKVAVYIKKLL